VGAVDGDPEWPAQLLAMYLNPTWHPRPHPDLLNLPQQRRAVASPTAPRRSPSAGAGTPAAPDQHVDLEAAGTPAGHPA
jgi:hypothetical protein